MSSCNQMVVYGGQVCLNELTKWQQYFSPQSDVVYLQSDTNQEKAQDIANLLLEGLD